MELINIDYKEFKAEIYQKYIEIFPEEERKSLETIEKNYNKNITRFIKIDEEKELIGFCIMNSIENNRYMQLDYFAILPEYQNKGYGTKAIKELEKVVQNRKILKKIY